jgi:Domain of unknown function (DUF5063)
VSGEDRFVPVARRFVSFVEGFDALSADEFVCELEPLLLDLYSSALVLERRRAGENLGTERQRNDEWSELFQRLGRHLGRYDAYSFVFDPYELDAQPVTGMLSDDLSDICRDLCDGIERYDVGHTREAIWEWRFGFESHWGRHAAHALYALRVLRIDHPG